MLSNRGRKTAVAGARKPAKLRRLLFTIGVGLASFLLVCGLATHLLTRQIERRNPPRGEFLSLEGGQLHLIDVPAGIPNPDAAIVFLHGASASALDLLVPLRPKLSQRFRLISVDRPGSGWSDRFPDSSPRAQAAGIVEALKQRGVEEALLVGHSWGGALGLELALDHPAFVAGLVLLAPVSHPWPGGIATYYRLGSLPLIGWLLSRTVGPLVGYFVLNSTLESIFAPQQIPAGYVENAETELALRPATFHATARDVAGLYDFVRARSPEYKRIRTPTVIISGDTDTVVWTNLHSRSLEREIEGAKLAVLAGVGHMPHHAAPNRVASELEKLALERERR